MRIMQCLLLSVVLFSVHSQASLTKTQSKKIASMQVWIVTAVGKRLSVEVTPDTTVGELYSMASERLELQASTYFLVHQGKALDAKDSADVTMETLNVQKDTSFHCIVRMRGGSCPF